MMILLCYTHLLVRSFELCLLPRCTILVVEIINWLASLTSRLSISMTISLQLLETYLPYTLVKRLSSHRGNPQVGESYCLPTTQHK